MLFVFYPKASLPSNKRNVVAEDSDATMSAWWIPSLVLVSFLIGNGGAQSITGIDDMRLLDTYPTFLFSTNFETPNTYVITEGGTTYDPWLTYAPGSYAQKFRIVKGLSGVKGTVSFQSVRYPTAYMLTKQWSDELDFEHNTGSSTFAAMASFYERDALDGSSAVSYESQIKPGYFISHDSFSTKMRVAKYTTSGYFTRDATWDPRILARFRPYYTTSLRVNAKYIGGVQRAYLSNTYVMEYMIVPPLSGTPGAVSIQSLRQSTSYLKPLASQGNIVCLVQRESTKAYELSASFYMRKALNGQTGVSFESVEFPGQFIGLQSIDGWITLKILPKSDTDSYKKYATFVIVT